MGFVGRLAPEKHVERLAALAARDALAAIPGPLKVVDSTFAGPMIQRPLEHGVDLVLHSATKGLSGHNDATLGVIAGA